MAVWRLMGGGWTGRGEFKRLCCRRDVVPLVSVACLYVCLSVLHLKLLGS